MTLQNIKISLRSDSLENWISSDPILKNGELVMVNDISAGLVRFKIGNGVSAFVQLPYVNEKKVITDFAKAKRAESQYFSQGVNNSASPLGFAAGSYLTADSSFSQVLGINACALEGHDYSFVWNGDGSGIINVQSYRSHGEGTFNVNPVSGVNGFYIGNQTLSGILSSTCQPKGNYLSSSALDGYRTYVDTKSSLSSDGYATQIQLDAKSAVSVDNELANINMLHISQDDYDQLVASGTALSNTLYIVSSDYIEACGQQVKNIAPGTDLSDAVNLQQLQAAVAGVKIPTDLSAFTNSPGYLTAHQSLSEYYTKNQTSSAGEISAAIEEYAGKKIYIDDRISGNACYSNLSVVKLSVDEYASMLTADALLSNCLYIVDNQFEDMYGQQVKNVAPGTDLSDAVNLGQVTQISSSLYQHFDKLISCNSKPLSGQTFEMTTLSSVISSIILALGGQMTLGGQPI